MFRRLVCALAPMLPLCAVAATNQFTYTGPNGAYVQQVEYVDGAGTVLAMTGRRIYRSTDHGANWTMVQATRFGGYTAHLVVNPADRNQALALLDRLYRSSDGGASWTAVTGSTLPNNANGEKAQCFTWSRDGARIWAGTNDGAIYRSADGGLTWTRQFNGVVSSVTQLDVDATDPNRAYARTPAGLYATTNGGTNWTAAGATPLTWIAASPTQTGVLLAILTSDGTIARSTNYGVDFAPRSTEKPVALYYAPAQAGKVYAVYATANAKVSADEGLTWTNHFLFRSGVFDITISPTDGNRAILATAAGPLMTPDSISTLSLMTNGMLELVFNSLTPRYSALGAGTLYAATASGHANAFMRGADGRWFGRGGATTNLLGDPSVFVSFGVAPSDGTLFLARVGNFGASTDDDATWTRRGSADMQFRMAIDPTDSRVIYATDGFFNRRLTVDGGVNWAAMGSDLPEGIGAFAVNGKHPNRVYAVVNTRLTGSSPPFYVSENYGATWTASSWSGSLDEEGAAIAHEPGSENTVYIGLHSGLFKTTSGGASWTRLDPYPQTVTSDGILSISVDPRAPQTVYVSTLYDYPPMRSVDGGANWEPLHSAAADDEGLVEDVVYDPSVASGVAGRVFYGGLVEMTIAPDIALTSTGALTSGTAGSVNLIATNHGQYSATAVRMSTTLPVATGTYTITTSAGLVCALTGIVLACDAPILRPGASATATVGLTPAASGLWQATVGAREVDSATANNVLNLTVAAASSGGGGGGAGGGGASGGGGGRLDYLVLLFLGFGVVVNGVTQRRWRSRPSA